MRRDPVTITRAEAIRRRREEEQKRRESQTLKRAVTPRVASTQAQTERPTLRLTPASSRLRRRYDIAMSTPYGRSNRRGQMLEMPAIRIPPLAYGPRWISFLILAACIGLMYAISVSDTYLVRQATVLGNQRIQADELEMAMGILNQPSFSINPAQVEYNLLAAYPELASVQVQVGLPAEIIVQVRERIPVIAWQQAGQTVWVDEQGYAFPPRGTADGLAVVQAEGLPALPANFDINQTIGARPFMTPEMARAITALAPTMPEGASLVYDPEYGLGWQDPLGWQVYFGQRADDMPVKLKVYLSMVEYLLERDLKPELISVEFPSAPFYRMND